MFSFFFFIPGFPVSPHSFIFKVFVQYEMTRAKLFFKKGFEVCLLNKVFAAIIRLHIQIQTHFMLEVTENCYHLMALWAEFSQMTLHALNPSFWALPRETSRVWATLRLQIFHSGIMDIKSNCHDAMAWFCWSHPNSIWSFCYSHLFRVLTSYLESSYLPVGTEKP